MSAILFVCVHNARRGQVAALIDALAADGIGDCAAHA